jgi:hypothetical protein
MVIFSRQQGESTMRQHSQKIVLVVLGAIALALGVLVYLLDRNPANVYFLRGILKTPLISPPVFGAIGAFLPTFLHVFAFILISAAVLPSSSRHFFLVCLGWFTLEIVFELAQHPYIAPYITAAIPSWFSRVPLFENMKDYFLLGTFDPLDLLSITCGTLSAWITVTAVIRTNDTTSNALTRNTPSMHFSRLITMGALATLSVASIIGSGGNGGSSVPSSPVTTSSLASGIYDEPQTIILTTDRPATIYYSLDGNMPSVGSANTFSGPSPLANIQIAQDTNLLQYFAVDNTGGRESAKSETYVINNGAANGPGDPQNYYPIDQGNVWRNRLTVVETGFPTVISTTSTSVAGTKVINGATAVIMRESSPDTTGAGREDYNLKSSNGILLLGYTDPADTLSSQIVPYTLYSFTTQTNSSFVAFNRTGLDFGEDVDWDGVKETAAMSAVIAMKGLESVTVPVGTYLNCAKTEATLLLTVTLSSTHEQIAVASTQTNWFAPGVGQVKSIIATSGEDYSSTETDELIGYYVAGEGKGMLPQYAVASGVANANSDTEMPGKSEIAFDGTNYLAVYFRDGGSPGIYGVTLSGSGVGEILNAFPIAQLPQGSQFPRPAVAFDGNNYLVVYQQSGQIMGTRVSPTGTVLDSNGFAISTTGTSNWAPVIAFDGANYLVAWQRFGADYDIYGAFVTTGGQASTEFGIFQISGEQIEPSLAFDGTNYMVVWRDTRSGSGPSNDTDIYGTRVTKTGTVLDPSGIPISTASYYQGEPSIVFDGVNYFVVWVDQRNTQNYLDNDIYGALLKTDGTLLSGPSTTGGIAINTAPVNAAYVSVAYDGANYFVVWSVPNFSNDPHAGIFGARVSTNGNLVDGPSTETGISISGLPPAYSRYVYPDVLFNGENSLLIWTNNIELQGTTKSIEGILIYP